MKESNCHKQGWMYGRLESDNTPRLNVKIFLILALSPRKTLEFRQIL